ncbi:MAG: FAD-dependent monooxygenase, partial [Alphaproteobacteria bacterium]
IQMSPNAMRALRGLGLDGQVRRMAFQPRTWNNRAWDTGAVKFELTLGQTAEDQFGAPYLQMHRGDLHAALLSAVPARDISLGKRLVDVAPAAAGSVLSFADGTKAAVDLVVGADGVHSKAREILSGAERPLATGRVAYRATFPASLLRQSVGECTKWWGRDRHIVIYYVTKAKDEIYFVTSLPDEGWVRESWSATGDMAVVRRAFAEFHEEVREVLRACPVVHRWAILERAPLQRWFGEGLVLIGDAAHPMTPYMAQGAAMAIEDGVILARALEQASGIDNALVIFEAARKARTAQVQAVSHANTWMREETDPAWCYGYDPWTEPLDI